MKKIIFGIGIFSLMLGVSTAYAYLQDCPRRVEENGANIGQPQYQEKTYQQAYHHEGYHENCENCQKTTPCKYGHSMKHYKHNTANYGHHHSHSTR